MNKINFLTAGESHGQGLLGIIDGIPAGLNIDSSYINFHLSRRQKGFGRGGRMKIENDQVDLFCGIRLGQTIGAPIGLIVKNLDWDNWRETMSVDKVKSKNKKITLPRPGHADLAGILKYDFDDIRNVIERSSARETTMRVALGSICRKLLEDCNIYVGSYVDGIHDIEDSNLYLDYNAKKINELADQSELRALDSSIEKKMIETIKNAQKNKDTVGGKFKVIVSGVPYGLGSYRTWNTKLNAQLSEAILSINAIKSVEFGLKSASNLYGSQLHDEIGYEKNQFIRFSNNSGGIEGGMSNAQSIIINASMKPLSTLSKPLKSVNIDSLESDLAHKERTDSCAVPAASVIAESMTCLVVANALLDKFGGDSMNQLHAHIKQSAKY